MDAAYSLLNPGSSMNFDVPAVSVIQGKEEEEEAAEDEKNKEKELQDLLTNAFDDLIEDDEFNSSMFSTNKSQEGSFHDHKSSNQMLKNWLQDNKWIQNKNSEALSESCRKLEDTNGQLFQERRSSVDRYATNKDDVVTHAAQNGKLSVQNSLTSMADSVGNVSGYDARNTENNHYANAKDWDANSQIQLQEDGCYGAVGSEELTPSSDSRASTSSYGCQSSPSNPEERQVNGNHDTGAGQFYKPLDDFEYSQYQVQYVGEGLGHESQDWAKDNGNAEGLTTLDLQNQYMNAGVDGGSAEAIQFQILYRARGREIEKLQKELEQTKEQFTNDQKALRHQLARMKVDNEGLTVALKDCRHSLEESNQSSAQLQGTVAALETRTQALERTKEELINKLQVAESTIETLNHQVEELECSETLARARAQHEMVVASMQQRHESETLTLKEKVDSLRNQLEEKTEDMNNAKQQINKLNRLLENAQLDRADTINRLTKSLEESQRQCQDLLDTETIKDACQLHLRTQTAASSSAHSEKRIQSLQEEVISLKEELEMLESACQLGLFPEGAVCPEISQMNIRKKLDFRTPQFSGNKRPANGDLISTLKLELERSLVCNKDKRNKLMKLHAERQNAIKELDVTKAKLVEADMQISNLKAMNSELQAKLAEPRLGSAQHRDVEHLKKQRDHLTKELTAAHQQLAELEASEAKLTEANKRLSLQMAEMVKDCSEDRRQAVERCQQTYLQLHEDSLKKVRQEMTDMHHKEISELKDALNKLTKELDSVKEMYVTVCEEKNEIEAHFENLQDMHKDDTAERLKAIESSWQAKLKEAEVEKEKAVKSAVNIARVEKDSEWKLQLDNLRTEKDMQIHQKTMELRNASEASKLEALEWLSKEKDLEKKEELERMKEKWDKEKQGFMKTLQEKSAMEQDEFRTQVMLDKEVAIQQLEKQFETRIAELEEKLNTEKEVALLQLAEDKEKEKKQCLQQLTQKKNKEKWEKMRYLEQLKDSEKQNELRELEVKKNEELRNFQELKNNEMAEIRKVIKFKEKDFEEKLQRCKEKMKKDKQLLFNLLQESKSKTSCDELKAVNMQKEKEKQDALEVLLEEKNKELKTLNEQKDDEMMNALLQLANRKDREKENKVKELQENFNKQIQELQKRLSGKETELHTMEKTLTEKLQLESHEILVKFAARKEQEKVDALKELNVKRKDELEEALMSLTINKDAELKEALKMLEAKKDQEKETTIRKLLDEKERQMKEITRKYDSRMDASFFKILQDQNSELFKMLKAAREDFDKEKVSLQQQHSKVVNSLKEKNARLTSSQADQQNKNQEQAETAQQIASLTTQVSELDAELVQHKTKVRELETSLILKVQELERLQQQQSLETQEHLATIEELKSKLEEAAKEVETKTQACAQLQAEAEGRSDDVHSLQEKYEQLVHDLTNKFVEEKLRLQKNEEELLSNITQLQTKMQDKGIELQSLEDAKNKELNSLQQQLQQALKDKESALNTQNALESGTKSHQDALQESMQQQLALKEKLRRYHKYIQSREQQHQEILLKLQQEHGASLRELTIQLEELKKATEASAEQRELDLLSDHKNELAKVESQYKTELEKQIQCSEDFKNKLQHYESAYKQLQRDSSAETIAEIQDNIKQVVHVLQRDIFQYVDGLNQRVAQRIQNEVMKERNSIIASLREQFGIHLPRENFTIVTGNNPSAKHNGRSKSSHNWSTAIEKGKETEEKRASRKVGRETTLTDSGYRHQHQPHQIVPKPSDAMAESLIALLPTLRELGRRIPELLSAGDDAEQSKPPVISLLSSTVEDTDNLRRGHGGGVAEDRSSGFESANTNASYPSDVLRARSAPSNVKSSSHSSRHRAPHGTDASRQKISDGHREISAVSEEIKGPATSIQYQTATPTTAESQVSLNKPPVNVQKSPPSRKPSHRKVRRIASTVSQTSVASQATLENGKTLENTSSVNSLNVLREQPIGQSASDTGYNSKDKLSVGGMIHSTLNNLLTSVTDSLHVPDDIIRNKNRLNTMDKGVHLKQISSNLQGEHYSVPGSEESIQFVFGSNLSMFSNLAQPREYNPLPDHIGQAPLVSSKTISVGDNVKKTFLPLLTESDNSLGDEYTPSAPEQKGPKISSSSLSIAKREVGSAQTGVWSQFPSGVTSGN